MPRVPSRDSQHRVHDYPYLVQRWKRIARDAGLKLVELARAGEYPVYLLETRGAADDPAGLYLSAGIHGDEPAATEALVRWAEWHLTALAKEARHPLPLVILPCLNPWGLVNNRRTDERNRDLNRLFDRQDVSPVGEIRDFLRGRRFELAVTMHEDYDGQGAYLYELARRPPDLGSVLLKAVSRFVPLDPRKRIDQRPAKNGLMLRRANLARIPLHPEGIYLYRNQCDRVLTFETPSEFSIARRIDAQVRMLEVCAASVLRVRAAQRRVKPVAEMGGKGERTSRRPR